MGALEMGDKDLVEMNKTYKKRRDLICKHLDDMPHVFSYVRPESAYFVFPKIILKDFNYSDSDYENSLSWRFSLWLLDKIQVAVVPGVAFGPSGEDHVRMSFGRSTADINESFRRMKKFFDSK
jgi:aminotransferase